MSNLAFTIEQIDTWSKAANEGEKMLVAGKAAEQKARQAEQRKLPLIAAESYEQALEYLQQAVQMLREPAELAHEHTAIRTLSRSARERRDEAQQLIDTLQRENAGPRCRTAWQRADELLKEAARALEMDDSASARSKAIEASELDQSRSEEAEMLKRAADSEAGEAGKHTGLIIIGVVVLLLLVLMILFGPKLWAWISEFLFPAVALLPLLGN